MELTPPDSLQIPCDSGWWVHLPRKYDNYGCLASLDSSHITCITCKSHTSIHPFQAKFDTDVVSIGIYN